MSKSLFFTILFSCTACVASATVIFSEQVPLTNSFVGGYLPGVKLSGQNPTNTLSYGCTGVWITATSVIQANATGLSHPSGCSITDIGGSIAISNSTVGDATGRVQARAIRNSVSFSGTIFFSMLMNADATSLANLKSGQCYAAGFGSDGTYLTDTSASTLDSTAFYFGFRRDTGATNLICRVVGVNHALGLATPGVTYICVARIDLAVDGADIVHVSVIPIASFPGVESYQTSFSAAFITGAAKLPAYLLVAGAYATGGGCVRFDELRLATTFTEAVGFPAAPSAFIIK